MQTTHTLHTGDARELPALAAESVALVVTSPPYPLIAMWDEAFAAMDPAVATHLAREDGAAAFEAMHAQLDRAWAACARVLAPGGFACVNIGDATRSLGGSFRLWPNHARVITAFARLGFASLPGVIWRKPTNAPNKFMGSGMLPAGAYLTYEHEHILVFRKPGERRYDAAAKARRAESAYFWEERNQWFSDLWERLPGASQRLGGPRERSGAFPFELPYRLIGMYSLLGDTVLDPFAGTGTTLAAALACGRSSVGVEREPALAERVDQALQGALVEGPARARARLEAHARFVADRQQAGKAPGHRSAVYGFPVMTRQETALRLWVPVELAGEPGRRLARCAPAPAAQ